MVNLLNAKFCEIEPICAPLQNLGIPYFIYQRLYHDGSYIGFSNNFEYSKRYLQEVTDVGEMFLSKINSNKSLITSSRKDFLFFSPNIDLVDQKKDQCLHLLRHFNMWNLLITFRIKNLDYIEIFGFMTAIDQENPEKLYLENIQLLEHYIDYVISISKFLIEDLCKGQRAYLEKTYNFASKSEEEKTDIKTKAFLEATRIRYEGIKCRNGIIVPTQREIQCLEYMLLGHSMKSVANLLDLSPRTVENYFSNIKLKTGYTSKSELLSAFSKSKSLRE